MTLHKSTIESGLSDTKWLTVGQVTQYLRECGPLAFHTEDEYKDFHYATKARQYQTVYNGLMRLRSKGLVDSALGSDDGRLVRVFTMLGV